MIDWKNWKTGAKIGLFYGLVCALYLIPVLIAQYSPTPDVPIGQCDDACMSWYKLIGIIIFFPLVLSSALILNSFYQTLSAYQIILINSILVIVIGTILGAAIGHFFGWREKKRFPVQNDGDK